MVRLLQLFQSPDIPMYGQWLWSVDCPLRSCSVLFYVFSLSSRLNIFLATQTQNLLKLLQKGSRHTQILSKMQLKYCEATIHQHPQFWFIVFPQATRYDSKKTFVQKYTLLSSSNHMTITPNSLFDLVQAYSLYFKRELMQIKSWHKLTMQQTPLLFCLPQGYQFSDTATIALTLKKSSFFTQW